MLEPIEAGEFDVVIGSRFLSGSTGMPFLRGLSNRVSTYLVRLATGLSSSECTDSQCGFRVFGNDALEKLSDLESERFNIEAEALIAAVRNRLRIKEVPIHCEYSDSIGSNIKPSRTIITNDRFTPALLANTNVGKKARMVVARYATSGMM